ncbi:hypothetical protein FPV67DRAFT_1491496 [Lyophyllum atratum]|nr:hypothetical protein FPV67DRAFT_1491496 [Lyophyllum atratum]
MAELIPATPGSLKHEDLERTIGVFFVGYIFAMVLYGFTFFQSYMYYSRYPRDHWATKSTVALLCLVDTALTGLLSQTLYFYMVDLFPYTLTVEFATTPFCAQLLLSAIVVFIAQLYYAAGVWSATKNAVVAGLIALFSTAGFVLGIAMSVQLFQNRDLSHLASSPNKAVAGVYFGMVAASAVVASGFLSMSHLPAPYKAIRGPFDAIVSYVVSRGGAATIVQLALVFVFVGTPSRIYWMPFHVTAVKLFVVGAITMLNSRDGGETNLGKEERWGTSSAVTRTIGGTTVGNGIQSGMEFTTGKVSRISGGWCNDLRRY